MYSARTGAESNMKVNTGAPSPSAMTAIPALSAILRRLSKRGLLFCSSEIWLISFFWSVPCALVTSFKSRIASTRVPLRGRGGGGEEEEGEEEEEEREEEENVVMN